MFNMPQSIRALGYALLADVVSASQIGAILKELTRLSAGQSERRGSVYAARNLLATVPAVARLACSPELRSVIGPVLGRAAFPVRAILFDKVSGANWRVGWHQDQIIPVAARKEVPGFSAWSIKENVPHVRPPAAVLERMLSLRIHLDDCPGTNGALRVIPGSHANGILDEEQIKRISAEVQPITCEVKRGDVLAMRPLLLHSSAPASEPSHRRVIHLEYAAEPLPGGLEWPRWN